MNFNGKKMVKKMHLARRVPLAFAFFSFFGVFKIYTLVEHI